MAAFTLGIVLSQLFFRGETQSLLQNTTSVVNPFIILTMLDLYVEDL